MSHMMANFLGTFARRREYCRALLALAERQIELVKENDFSGLLELLARKQRVLGQLDQLTQSNQQLWEQWRLHRDQLSAEEREACYAVLEESEQILAEVLRQERLGAELLTAKRDETQRRLEQVSQGLQANEAYNERPSTHRHLDLNR